MNKTKIQWTESTLNLITGCSKVSAGCRYCYAERIFPRIYPGRDFDSLVFHPERMDKVKGWKSPRKIFVNSLSDTFHAGVPDEYIERIMQMMRDTPWHSYQILTKRPERAKQFFDKYNAPLNLRFGVSVENQRTTDERLPILGLTKVHHNFVSVEPLLGPIDISPYANIPDWLIVGGESGPDGRPMDLLWVDRLIGDCRFAKIPFFMKQMGTALAKKMQCTDVKGGDPKEWPTFYCIREYPDEETRCDQTAQVDLPLAR